MGASASDGGGRGGGPTIPGSPPAADAMTAGAGHRSGAPQRAPTAGWLTRRYGQRPRSSAPQPRSLPPGASGVARETDRRSDPQSHPSAQHVGDGSSKSSASCRTAPCGQGGSFGQTHHSATVSLSVGNGGHRDTTAHSAPVAPDGVRWCESRRSEAPPAAVHEAHHGPVDAAAERRRPPGPRGSDARNISVHHESPSNRTAGATVMGVIGSGSGAKSPAAVCSQAGDLKCQTVVTSTSYRASNDDDAAQVVALVLNADGELVADDRCMVAVV